MTLKGDAGIRYTPSGGSTKTHRLAAPLTLQLAAAHRTRRYVSDSLDLSTREVISVGTGRREVETTLRFDRNASDLLDVLRYGADGVTLTYYPSLSVGVGYDLWLISPGPEALEIAGDRARMGFGEYEVRVRFRDASDSGQSLEALFSPWLFKYSAGMAADDATFTRNSEGRQRGIGRSLETLDADVLRDGHFVTDESGLWVPSYLGEGAATNEFTRSEDLTHGDWTVEELDTRNANQATGPDGEDSLDELVENDAASTAHGVTQGATLTADADYAFSVWAMANTREHLVLQLDDAGSNFVRQWFNLATGATGSDETGGTGSIEDARVEDWSAVAAGLYRLKLVGSIGSGATAITGRIRLADADGSVAYTGDDSSSLYVGYAQLEDDSPYVSSYIPTTDSAGSRAVDSLRFPFVHAPQAMSIYLKLVEGGSALQGADSGVVWLGAANAALNPKAYISTGTNGYQMRHTGDSTTVQAQLSTAPDLDQPVEIVGRLYPDGHTDILQSIDGGSITSAEDTTTLPLESAWAGQRIYVNSKGSITPGRNAFVDVVVLSGVRTMDECRAKAGA